MRVQNNIMAMNAYRNYNMNNTALSKNLEKLSSGYAINRAGDDAAGLAISEKMRAQITGLSTAQDNAQDGISLIQTAEGALTEVHDMLNRMYELANKASNGTYDQAGGDRQKIQDEITELFDEINRISETTEFNGISLLNGATASGIMGDDFEFGAASLTITTNSTSNTINGVNINFASSSTATAAGATASSGGTITVTLVEGETYSTEVISQLINTAVSAAIDKLDPNSTTDQPKIAKLKELLGIKVAGADKVFADTSATGTATLAQDGSKTGGTFKLQIGWDGNSANQLDVTINNCSATSILGGAIDVSTGQTAAINAMSTIETAINTVSSVRSGLGAAQNRLEHTINNLSVTEENVQAAESSIRDTDVADEMMEYTKNNILIQSAQAMLAQANQVPQGVLQLLQ